MNQTKLHGIKSLDFTSEKYMDVHLNFRTNLTNQGILIQEILQEKLKSHVEANNLTTLKLASIGSGTGIIDAPLIDYMQKFAAVDYLGIEPNEYENTMAQRSIDKILSENSKASFFPDVIEEFQPDKNTDVFDAIIAVHVTYYSPSIRLMVEKALSMLHPKHGALYTVVSANTKQNELFAETTEALHGFTPVMAAGYKKLLDDIGVNYKTESIEANIDVSGFIDSPDTEECKKFLDFFLHADSSSIPNLERDRFIEVISQAANESGERNILPHVAELVTVTVMSN